jgi:uncharacterized membrane protein
MNEIENTVKSAAVARLPLLAAVVAVVGLIDSVYLTIHHLTAETVPCGQGFDCGAVLSSQYAEIAGIPLAAFGVAAYFIAFSLATLAAFGNRKMWFLFGVQVTLMAMASAYFVYLQAFVIKAYCQYCLLSAGICFTLFTIALISKFWKK